MRLLLLVFAVCLVACSSNHVEQLSSSEAVIKYSSTEGYEDRYINLFAKFKDYPVTCTEDCYQPNDAITCQQYMEQCTYTGGEPQLKLDTGFSVTWLGHANFRVTTADGQQFWFDPVFGQFDWPVNWAFRIAEGYNRNEPTPPSLETLSATDAVMYSHIHYDHFNKGDIQKFGQNTAFLTPLGFASHFPRGGYNISEMPWYTSKQLGDTTITFMPAHHFSNRIIVPYLYEDENKVLWGGWLLEHKGAKLFFAGDTGYSPHFKEIKDKYGAMDICLLPIASYFSEESPDWYRKVHMTPEDALTAAADLNCKVMVPWGYGNNSWQMGDKTSHSALFRLFTMYERLGSDIPLYILNEGDSVSF